MKYDIDEKIRRTLLNRSHLLRTSRNLTNIKNQLKLKNIIDIHLGFK